MSERALTLRAGRGIGAGGCAVHNQFDADNAGRVGGGGLQHDVLAFAELAAAGRRDDSHRWFAAVAASKSHASATRLNTSNNAKGLNFGRAFSSSLPERIPIEFMEFTEPHPSTTRQKPPLRSGCFHTLDWNSL